MRTETSGRFDLATGGAATLRSPVAQKHKGNGAEENLDVEPERPVVEIKQVELHPMFEVDMVAAFESPQAGQPGTHAQTPPLPRFVFLDFLRNGRPRADERHVSAHDVPQLRQLINAQLAEPSSQGSAARVVFHLENGTVELVVWFQLSPQLISVLHHGTKLQQGKFSPA